MPSSSSANPLYKLKQLLKSAGYATHSMGVARTLLELIKEDETSTLDPTNLNQLQFAMLLLRTGTRLPGAETQAAFRLLARGSKTLDLVAATQRAEAPKTDRKLRTPEQIITVLKDSLTSSRDNAPALFKKFARRASPGTSSLNNKQFADALRSFGIDATPGACAKLFMLLDKNRGGTVDYEEFMVSLVGVLPENLGRGKPKNNPAPRGRNGRILTAVVNELHDRLTNTLSRVGARRSSVLETYRAFLKRAGSTDQKVNRTQFTRVLTDYGIELEPNQLDMVFNTMDRGAKGHIDLNDFVAIIFPQQSTSPKKDRDYLMEQGQRIAARKDKFAASQGIIDSPDVLYNELRTKLHKAVDGINASFKYFLAKAQCGPKIQFKSFMMGLRAFGLQFTEAAADGLFRRLDTNEDGVIAYQEFIDGLMQVSNLKKQRLSLGATVDDRHARGMAHVLRAKEQQRQETRQKAAMSRASSLYDTVDVAKVLRESLLQHVSGPANFFKIYKVFKNIAGARGASHINFENFKRALATCGCDLSHPRQQADAKAVFKALDTNEDGTVDYQEVVQNLFGVDETGLQEAVDWNVRAAKRREVALSRFAAQARTIESSVELWRVLSQRINADENGLRQSFQHFRKMSSDSNSGGNITLEGFRAALRSFMIMATDLASESLFFDIDADSNGVIDFNEFCAALNDANLQVAEAQEGRLYKHAVHPSDEPAYRRACKNFPLLTKAPSSSSPRSQDMSVDEMVEKHTAKDLDDIKDKVKSEYLKELEHRLTSAELRHNSVQKKLKVAKRELGLLPDVSPGVSPHGSPEQPEVSSNIKIKPAKTRAQRPQTANPVMRRTLFEQRMARRNSQRNLGASNDSPFQTESKQRSGKKSGRSSGKKTRGSLLKGSVSGGGKPAYMKRDPSIGRAQNGLRSLAVSGRGQQQAW